MSYPHVFWVGVGPAFFRPTFDFQIAKCNAGEGLKLKIFLKKNTKEIW
jgi:hypothetical protein